MAADSPTPGTPPPCAACGYQHNPLGWCKANVCTDCGLGQHAGPDHYDGCPAAPSPVDTTESPAEAQQDDERHAGVVREATDLCWKATPYALDGSGSIASYLLPAGVVHRLLGQLQAAGHPAAFRQAALAARPSADTETLRARIEKLVQDVDEHWAALIPDYEITDALRAALDAR